MPELIVLDFNFDFVSKSKSNPCNIQNFLWTSTEVYDALITSFGVSK